MLDFIQMPDIMEQRHGFLKEAKLKYKGINKITA